MGELVAPVPRPLWQRAAPFLPAAAAAAVARLPSPLTPQDVVVAAAGLLLVGGLLAQAMDGHRRIRPLQRLLALDAGVAAGLLLTLPPPLRDRVLASPGAAAAFALAIGVHLAWAVSRAIRLAPRTPAGFRNRAEAFLAELLPARVAGLAAAELDVLRYALVWGMRPDIPHGAQAFTYHRTTRPIFWTLVVVSLVELGLTHLLVGLAAPKAGWMALALTELGLIYLLGAGNSLAKRPILLTATDLDIRTGVLIEARIPLTRIARVRQVADAGDLKRPGFLKASLLAYPNVLIEITEPVSAAVAFKRPRAVTTIGVHPDDPAAFVAAVVRAKTGG